MKYTTFIIRVLSFVVKEFLILFRDPKARIVLIAPPLLQLFIFAHAMTLEVKNISIGILNQDNGKHSQEIIQLLNGSSVFSNLIFLHNEKQIKPLMDTQKVIGILKFSQEFSNHIETGGVAKVQVLLDGRRSNSAQIISGYIGKIVNNYNIELIVKSGKERPKSLLQIRNWFNENLLYTWYTVPCLVAVLSMLTCLLVTSLSIARERELGTLDQLLVTPLTPLEIIIGKIMPGIIIGFSEALLIWTVAIFIFKIPFTGSILILMGSTLVFIMSIVGVGLFISTISKNQQQGILGTFTFMVPAVMLSGFATPIENMPKFLQVLTEANPLRHFLRTVKGLFLKNMPFSDIWPNTWPLIIIGTIIFSLAYWYFKNYVCWNIKKQSTS